VIAVGGAGLGQGCVGPYEAVRVIVNEPDVWHPAGGE
jgi:hypothetical protein